MAANVRIIPPKEKEPATLRVAAYCRVSSDSSDQLHSYAAQIRGYTEEISKHQGWKLVDVYADEGLSGTSMKKRAEFNRMIAACKRGRIDMILTKSPSRFARNTVDCLKVIRTLKSLGIGVIFEKENINTLTESSEFLITLFSSFSQAERESISKNVGIGMKLAFKEGKVSFQYKKLLGYRKGADGGPEIVPEEAETVRLIYRLYLDGWSLGDIQRELTEKEVPTAEGIQGWSRQVIQNILTNEKYIGDALLQKTYITDCISKKARKNQGELPIYYVENSHPAIISRDIFCRVKEEMARRASKRKVMQKTGKTEHILLPTFQFGSNILDDPFGKVQNILSAFMSYNDYFQSGHYCISVSIIHAAPLQIGSCPPLDTPPGGNHDVLLQYSGQWIGQRQNLPSAWSGSDPACRSGQRDGPVPLYPVRCRDWRY